MQLMELDYHPFLLLLLTYPLILLFKYTWSTRQKPPRGRLPPGPWELPVLGSIHHLLGGSTQQLPHRALQKLAQKYGPLMHLRLGEVSTIVISSAETAREVFTSHDVAMSDRSQTNTLKVISYGYQDLVFAAYGEYWRQLRKICVLELLSHKRVKSFQFIREEVVLNLIRSISSANGSPVNISKMLYSMTNDITARAVMWINTSNKHQEEFLKLLHVVVSLTTGFSLADLFPSSPLVGWISGIRGRVLRCHKDLDQIMEDIIEEHRQRRRRTESIPAEEEDLVDVLLKIQEEGGSDKFQLSDEGIKALVFDIFVAGSETSANTMEWAMTELLRNSKVMEKVQSEVREVIGGKGNVCQEDVGELNYLKLVIKETMRLHMPVPLLVPRECRETCQLLGYEIPAKTRVVVNAWAMGMDSHNWDDPEEFKPERFDGSPRDFMGACFDYIPFGAGRRMCPGISFGLASLELGLAQLLYHFDWKLPNGRDPGDLDVEEVRGATVRRKFNLILCATTPRASCSSST